MEYEELSVITDILAERVAEMLQHYKDTGEAIELGTILKNYLSTYPHSQHFDLARLVVDQAVRLGYSEADFQAVQPDWQSINEFGAKVQANVIDKY